MDSRLVWSTAAGTVATTSGASAVTWAVGATTTNSSLPPWPAYVLGGMTLVAFCVLMAALARWGPFRHARSAAEMLDERIQRGYELRRRTMLINHVEAGKQVWAWTEDTDKALRRLFPAAVDDFLAAHGDQQQFYGARLAQATLNARVAVLQKARGFA